LKWSKWVRQTHRWPSIAFAVAVNIVAAPQGKGSSKTCLAAVFPMGFF
jgi:hypothetical protein